MEESITANIEEKKEELAVKIMERQFSKNPRLRKKYRGHKLEKCLEDISYNLAYLCQALKNNNQELFTKYMQWVNETLNPLGISNQELIENINSMGEVLAEELPRAEDKIIELTRAAISAIKEDKRTPSHLKENNPQLKLAEEYLDYLLKADRNQASKIIIEACQQGVEIRDIYLNVFQPVMREVGRLWQLNKVSIAQEHFASATTQLTISQFYPQILNSKPGGYSCLTACVGEELHEMGVRMMADLLELEGWQTLHLGANTPVEEILTLARKKEMDVIAISVTMAYHLPQLERLTELLAEERDYSPALMVGGYPFNISPGLWKKMKADGSAPNAALGVEKAKELMAEKEKRS